MKLQKTPIIQSNLKKENGAEGIRLPGFRLYLKAIVIKTVWHWPKKKRNVDQQNRIEGPEINPCTHGQLVYNKRGKNIYTGEKTVSSISGTGKTDFFNWNIVGLLTQCCVDSGVQQSNSAFFIIIKNHSILLTCNKFTHSLFFFPLFLLVGG